MFKFETIVLSEQEASRIISAFYRFIALNPAPDGETPSLHQEIIGAHQRCVVNLWSQEALDAFRALVRRSTPAHGSRARARQGLGGELRSPAV